METPTTIAAFREYLQTPEPASIVGYAWSTTDCPLLRYLSHVTGDISLRIGYSGKLYCSTGFIRDFELWEERFVHFIDNGQPTVSSRSAFDSLQALELAESEVNLKTA